MKMTKKKVLVAALLVCAIAILSLGTVAWFNAADSITNKFMIADSDNIGTPNFSVDVWETENDNDDTADADGDGDNVKTQAGNEYDSIAPGDVLPKDPTVENTGDYDQWIRVIVTVDEFSKIEAACQRHGISSDVRTWFDVDDTVWTADDNATAVVGDTVQYTYYLNEKLVKDAKATLFTEVSVPTAFEQEDMAYASGDFAITVKAQAIQADNTEATAKASFEAYWDYE